MTLGSNVSRRTALAALLLTAGLPLRAAETDAGAYGVVDLDWHDTRRARAVPVRLYLPGGPAVVPLVVFSHGLGGTRFGYSYLGRHFAGHGVASLHLQHVGSDRQVWTGGSPWQMLGRLQEAAQEGEAIHRAHDLRFALDQLLHSELAPRIDPTRIAAAGHSYGANTTLLAAGARIEREGRPVDLQDPRVRAAIVISAPPFYGYGYGAAADILAPVTLPSLHVTATEDIIRIPGYYSDAADRVKIFDATGSPRKALAVFAGGSHSMFTDRSGTGGVTLNPQVKVATQELSLAFLNSVFRGEDAGWAGWPQRHAAIVARYDERTAAVVRAAAAGLTTA